MIAPFIPEVTCQGTIPGGAQCRQRRRFVALNLSTVLSPGLTTVRAPHPAHRGGMEVNVVLHRVGVGVI